MYETVFCECGCGQEMRKSDPVSSFGRASGAIPICGVFTPGVTNRFRESCIAKALREMVNGK
jgi:hypothetical protein